MVGGALPSRYAETAVIGLSWRWGFTDPTQHINPGDTSYVVADAAPSFLAAAAAVGAATAESTVGLTCTGPFLGSEYCAYGHEWECYVMGVGLVGHDCSGATSASAANNTVTCQAACAAHDACEFWVLNPTAAQGETCKLKTARGELWQCKGCAYGPKHCPGWNNLG